MKEEIDMKEEIEQQLNCIERALAWSKQWQKGKISNDLCDALIQNRRKLKKIKFSLNERPAVVLYGQSQCGKSHLANILLSKTGKVFSVTDPDTHKEYPYLERMNSAGKGESTGLITRFTTTVFSTPKGYPIKLKMMSVCDMVLMLSEAYYTHVLKGQKPMDKDKLSTYINELSSKTVPNRQSIISEDDIWDIKDYFDENFSDVSTNELKKTEYLEKLSRIVEYLPVDVFCDALAYLWNKEENFTELFNNFIKYSKSLKFQREAFVPIDALLNCENLSLLSVAWLDELDKDTNTKVTVCLNKEGSETIALDKAYIAALCTEVIIPVGKDYLEDREFLDCVDILDFPGARGKQNAVDIRVEMNQLLRRGKVDFYFNKYSSYKQINSLLFCWEPDNFEAKPMSERLTKWVLGEIGETKEKRTRNVERFGVPPLFFIGTKFNTVLSFGQTDSHDNKIAFNERWKNWFQTQLYKDIIGGDLKNEGTHKWFDDWTDKKPYFNNIYLLRDFQYSGDLFSGWTRDGKVESEVKLNSAKGEYPEFRDDLKRSFCKYDFVRNHFDDPEAYWNAAASIANDGSELILKKLNESSEKIAGARDAKFNEDLQDILKNIIDELDKHYFQPSSEADLKKALRMAGEAQAALSIMYGRNPYFFGEMMKHFVLDESAIYNIFHQEFQKGQMNMQINPSKYMFVRMKAQALSPDNEFETNLKILMSAFHFENEDSCKQYFELRGIDLKTLFELNEGGFKKISKSLAERVEKFWFDEWINSKNYQALKSLFVDDETSLQNIVEMFRALYKKLKVTDRMSLSISEYVDRFGVNVDDVEQMIADMCSEMLNKFVSNVGYCYMSEDEIENLREANDKMNFGIDFKFTEVSSAIIQPANIAEMFDAMDNLDELRNNPSDEKLCCLPGYANKRRWCELVKMGFVLTHDIPNYNVEANNQLGIIFNDLNKLNVCQS